MSTAIVAWCMFHAVAAIIGILVLVMETECGSAAHRRSAARWGLALVMTGPLAGVLLGGAALYQLFRASWRIAFPPSERAAKLPKAKVRL